MFGYPLEILWRILPFLFWLKMQVTPDFSCQEILEAKTFKEKDVDYLSSIDVICLSCHFSGVCHYNYSLT